MTSRSIPSLLAVVTVAVAVTALTTISDVAVSSSSVATAEGNPPFSYEQCRAWGFDPSNLSCDTCSLLFEDEESSSSLSSFYPECKTCCQKWRKNPLLRPTHYHQQESTDGRRTNRHAIYRSAAVVAGSAMVERLPEVKEFFEQDLADLVKLKGEHALGTNEVHHMQPPVLLFFKGPKETGGPDADEVILLDKWKRDDIRDLLTNLLPDAS